MVRKANSLGRFPGVWVPLACGLFGAALIAAYGCRQGSSPTNPSGTPQTTSASPTGKGSANDTGHGGVTQAALEALTGDPVSAVKVFLEAVKTGDDEKVVQLFSEQARQQAGKLNRQFAPVGSDTARYQVFTDVEYLAPDGARVKSTWTDLDSQGQPRTDEITWMLRKEDHGWRIAGMATVVFEGEPPLLLDFENMSETLRKIELLSQEMERRASQARQAQASSSAGTPANTQPAPPSDTAPASAATVSTPTSDQGRALPAAPAPPGAPEANTAARPASPTR